MSADMTARARRRRRRITLVSLVAVAVLTPLGANLATRGGGGERAAIDVARLPHVDGYIKEATRRRVVVEEADGLFRNLDVGAEVSAADLAHMQDHARYGTPSRLPYVTRDARDFVVTVQDLDSFEGVERPPARSIDERELKRVVRGDSRRRVLDVLGPPLEIRFDHTAERDCWRWPVEGDEDALAEVCMSAHSRPRVLRVGMTRR